LGIAALRWWGGWGNAAAILLFLGLTLFSALVGAADEAPPPERTRPDGGEHPQPDRPDAEEIPDLRLD
jgi:hypothetical protein